MRVSIQIAVQIPERGPVDEDIVTNLLCQVSLNFYITIPNFKDLKSEAIEQRSWKGRNNHHFLPFYVMILDFKSCLVFLELSSLAESKMLLFGTD